MNTYKQVKKILTFYPECRNSDKKLLWHYWNVFDLDKWPNEYEFISSRDFLQCTPAESITRARRAVQKAHANLRATKKIQEARTKKANNPNGWLF